MAPSAALGNGRGGVLNNGPLKAAINASSGSLDTLKEFNAIVQCDYSSCPEFWLGLDCMYGSHPRLSLVVECSSMPFYACLRIDAGLQHQEQEA